MKNKDASDTFSFGRLPFLPKAGGRDWNKIIENKYLEEFKGDIEDIIDFDIHKILK
jgi:hypothetical protein